MNAPIYADFDQIVFEGRSKDYGAYHMRKRYNRVLMRASLIAFLLFISITGLPKMISWIMPKMANEVIAADDPEMIPAIPVETPAKPEVKPELPELPRIKLPEVHTVAFSVPTPTPDDQIQDEQIIAEVDDLDNVAIGLVNKDGVDGDYDWIDFPPGDCKDCLPDEVKIPDTDEDPSKDAFVLLEKEPMPINLDELKNLIGYPPMAKEAEIEGKVTLRVMVDPFGNYVKHAVLKDPHPILTKAVTDKIHLLKTTPGIQAGRPIKVWVTVPINFVLQK